MTGLLDLLAGRADEAVVLRDDNAEPLTVGQLRAAATTGHARPEAVVVTASTAREALIALATLDGRAAEIVLDGSGVPGEPYVVTEAELGRAAETRWVLLTSGTTGEPKRVSTTLGALLRGIRPGVGAGAWGLLYGWNRFAGLQVVLQALASGGHLLVPPRTTVATEQVAFLRDHRCTHLSATPSLYRRLLMVPTFGDLPLQQVTLGGEIADQRVLSALKRAFPTARLVHIFASTEAGVAFTVRDGLEGFPASLLDSPPPGVDLAVVEGTLRVRATGGDWVDTEDAVDLQGDRYMFLGRRSGVVNVGGANVYPEVLERFLLEQDGVTQAQVSARPSSLLGSLLVADVVAPGEGPGFDKAILAACRAALPRYLVPSKVRLVEALSVNAGGKLTRGAST
ncbi:MAG: acyl--CoA ligase [Frankiales bacterium]|nr:acyl--CoA ligase [Frankiales bacterium]